MPKNPYHGPWPRVRLAVLDRDGWACQIKGQGCTGKATDADHIVPISEGGAWYDTDNLRAACAKCNRGRSHKRMTAMAKLNRQQPVEPSRDW